MIQPCKRYTITEYESFTRGDYGGGYQALPEKTFDALEAFILANRATSETETLELLGFSARRGIGKLITARNYVGVITMTDGTVIEILPKIARKQVSECETKRIFLSMLKTLKELSFKRFDVSNLKTDRLNLLEIFIRMFLDEVAILTKQGLKASYLATESNERFYKGKLITPQNIKYNLLNKERFFVCYDHFNINRSENRLIKSTLLFLLQQTSHAKNRQNAARLLAFFDGVEASICHKTDFSKCFADRSMTHYEKALLWARIFLQGNSFTAFAGSDIALALLFPMEKVFESFIAEKFRQHVAFPMTLLTQDKRHSLFDSPRRFALKPDIVLKGDGTTIVMDTKWKLLADNASNYGISQSDMYQMYAYSKKYNAYKVILLYPDVGRTKQDSIKFVSNDNVNVDVAFIDLLHPDESMCKLLQAVNCAPLHNIPQLFIP